MKAATTSHDCSTLERVWRQRAIPVIWILPKPSEGLRVRLDHTRENGDRLRNGRRRIPRWSEEDAAWVVPNAWVEALLKELTPSFGAVYVLQIVRDEQTCNHSCWRAHRERCECSCMGENHAVNERRDLPYKLVSTESVVLGERRYACRKYVSKWWTHEQIALGIAENVRSVASWPEALAKRGISSPGASSLGPAPGVGGTRSRA